VIVIKLKSDGNKFSVTGKGHAAYNPGQDIVCSAVSCLFYAFAGYLINREDIKCKYRLDSGDSEIEAEGYTIEDVPEDELGADFNFSDYDDNDEEDM